MTRSKSGLQVSGIYKTGLEEYDQKFAIVDIRILQQLLDWNENQVGGFEVFIDDIDDLDAINEHIYIEKIPNDLYSQTIRDKSPNIFEWLELQDINEIVILALMIIVSIINMVTALDDSDFGANKYDRNAKSTRLYQLGDSKNISFIMQLILFASVFFGAISLVFHFVLSRIISN